MNSDLLNYSSLVSIIIAYLLGSFSSAIIIARVMGLSDPRLSGSKNAGATNMNRLYGKYPAILTLLLDSLKGVFSLLVAQFLNLSLTAQILTGLFVILGHIYPIFFSFKGGKGVATFIGVLLAFYYPSFILFTLSWFVVAKVFKISSLSALIASLINLLAFWLFFDFDLSVQFLISLITLLIFYTHRENIQRLFLKQEASN